MKNRDPKDTNIKEHHYYLWLDKMCLTHWTWIGAMGSQDLYASTV
jgi:hypothetical protein